MNKPKWVTRKNRRWKIVTWDLHSQFLPSERHSYSGHMSVGTALYYQLGTIVKSPNGVDSSTRKACTEGIHAYSSLRAAKRAAHGHEQVLVVYAPRWYGKGEKQRAAKVYVSSITRKLRWIGKN